MILHWRSIANSLTEPFRAGILSSWRITVYPEVIAKARVSMKRDVDPIIEQLTATIPGVRIEQLKVKHPGADDDGLWFINIPDQEGEVQLESSDGICPFLIESDFNNERFYGHTVQEVVATVRRLFSLV